MSCLLRKHSPALYRLDECVSAFQKSIRRGLPDEAVFFAMQIVNSGYVQYLFHSQLFTFVQEDIGIAHPRALIRLWRLYTTFQDILSTKKLKPSKAGNDHDVRLTVVEAVLICVHARKTRMTATAAGLSSSLVPNYLTPLTKATSQDICAQLDKELDNIKDGDDADADGSNDWRHLLILTNAICMAGARLRSKNVVDERGKPIKVGSESHPFTGLMSKFLTVVFGQLKKRCKPSDPVLKYAKRVLMCVEDILDESGPTMPGKLRLHLFTAVLLVGIPHQANWEAPYIASAEVCETYVKKNSDFTARLFAISIWALDKHTARGKGQSTIKILDVIAKKTERDVEVNGWSQEERNKSHGEGVIIAKDTSLVTEFFEVGAHVATQWGADPFQKACKRAYLEHEKTYGSAKTKSKYMTEQLLATSSYKQWIGQYFDIALFSSKDEDSCGTDDDSSNKESEKVKKSSKKSKSEKTSKKESSSMDVEKKSNKRKRDKDSEDSGEDENLEKKKKPRAPRKKPTAVSLMKFPVTVISSDGDNDSHIQPEWMTASYLDQHPIGQLPCGASKKRVYQLETVCVKGPYDRSKAGDCQKLSRMWLRYQVYSLLGVSTPGMKYIQSSENASTIYVCFDQLASIPREKWKVAPNTTSGASIVDRESMGLVQCSKMRERLWSTDVKLLIDVLVILAISAAMKEPVGDTHLGNVLYRASTQSVFRIDYEETRQSELFDGSGKEPLWPQWCKLLFTRTTRKEIVQEMSIGIRRHNQAIANAFVALFMKIESPDSDPFLQEHVNIAHLRTIRTSLIDA